MITFHVFIRLLNTLHFQFSKSNFKNVKGKNYPSGKLNSDTLVNYNIDYLKFSSGDNTNKFQDEWFEELKNDARKWV